MNTFQFHHKSKSKWSVICVVSTNIQSVWLINSPQTFIIEMRYPRRNHRYYGYWISPAFLFLYLQCPFAIFNHVSSNLRPLLPAHATSLKKCQCRIPKTVLFWLICCREGRSHRSCTSSSIVNTTLTNVSENRGELSTAQAQSALCALLLLVITGASDFMQA